MPAPYHGVSGRLLAKPGKGKELLDILLDAARGMETVPGCLCYIVGTDEIKPDTVHVYEVWTDAAAHRASLNMPVFQTLIERARHIIAGMENDPDLRIHGGKASALRRTET